MRADLDLLARHLNAAEVTGQPRSAVVLRALGMTADEIAAVLGVTPGTVSTYRWRVGRQLQRACAYHSLEHDLVIWYREVLDAMVPFRNAPLAPLAGEAVRIQPERVPLRSKAMTAEDLAQEWLRMMFWSGTSDRETPPPPPPPDPIEYQSATPDDSRVLLG